MFLKKLLLKRKIYFFFSCLLIISITGKSQILGGGSLFATAVTFNQGWISGCPGGGTSFSNQVTLEPVTTMDPCAPAPACATGTTESDVWYRFFAQSATATIVVAPSSSFDVAIQAFSGSTCPGLTQIGCIDANGNNATETLILTGLTANTRYYFRIFGATNSSANRTGTYTFCGSSGLGSAPLPVTFGSFNAFLQNNKTILNWTTETEYNNSHFEIERSANGVQYNGIGRVNGNMNTSQTSQYSFTDVSPLNSANYYRLKQVDMDGRFKYSAVVVIKMNKLLEKSISISPNPVTDKINLRISSDVTTNGDIRIVNASGVIMHRQKINLAKGENVISLNHIPGLSKGVYTARVIMDNEILSGKFIY